MLMGEPLVLELTTTAIQYKDSILIFYLMYRSNLSTSTSEFGYFETCYWFYYPKKNHYLCNTFFYILNDIGVLLCLWV